MKVVKVLHAEDTRNAPYWEREEVMAGLTNGCFYLAGEVEVDAEVDFENHDCRANYLPILSQAYHVSQNDCHPNPVLRYESGNPVYGPAVWNGKFAQRSSQHGDLMVVDGQIYRVERVGFKHVVAYGILKRHRGITLADNPEDIKPDYVINEEFDSLITD